MDSQEAQSHADAEQDAGEQETQAGGGGASGGAQELDSAEEALLEALLTDDGAGIEALEAALDGEPGSEEPESEEQGPEDEGSEDEGPVDESAETDADRGTPPEAEPGPPAGMDEDTFAAYVESAGALLFASPEPLTVGRLLELLTAAEKEAERAAAAAAKAEEAARSEADAEAGDGTSGDDDSGKHEPGDDEPAAVGPELEGDPGVDSDPEQSRPEHAKQPKRVKLTKAGVLQVLAALSERFEEARLPIVVREIAGGWRLFTDERFGEVVMRLDRSRRVERISQAALETLAIIAYRQPVTKAEIEAIRGVQAGPVLRQLVDRRLAKVAGRADQPGSPLLYGTTEEFLDRFSLASIEDLPRDGELARD